MSQEYFPQPEQNSSSQQGDFSGSLDKDEAALSEATRYVTEFAPTWVLEPTGVTIEQPDNQVELIRNLDAMLGSKQDGDVLRKHLQVNLGKIRGMQTQPEHYGFGKLNVKAGYNLQELRQPGDNLTRDEYSALLDDSWPEREKVEDIDQPNVMVSGLLLATGAEVLRNDVSEDGGVKRIYKGMLDEKSVYFEEQIVPRSRGEFDPNREVTTHLERSFTVISEHAARLGLNALSTQDADVLRSIGVEVPALHSPEYNPDTYPNRSRMIETIQLYSAMKPGNEDTQ